jgi:nitroreductase
MNLMSPLVVVVKVSCVAASELPASMRVSGIGSERDTAGMSQQRKATDAMKRRDALIGVGTVALTAVGASLFEFRRMGSMEEYNASVLATRSMLAARPDMRDLIRFATLAPNGHNTQAWRFRLSEGQIDILPDYARRTPIVDPDDHHLFVSLGAAAENLAIAAASRGRAGRASFNPAGDGSVAFAFGEAGAPEPNLFDAIPRRQSTRADYDGRAVAAADLQSLAKAAESPGVDLVLITKRPQMNRVRDLILAGNSAQLADPAFVRELKSWIRFSPQEAMTTGDGLFAASSGNPVLPDWLGPFLFAMVFKIDAENDKCAQQIKSSAGVAVFVSERDDKEHWVSAGRACQRFALQATALGIKTAFLNQPVEVARLRPELAALVGLPGRRPDIVMRFGYGPTLPFSARRQVEALLA